MEENTHLPNLPSHPPKLTIGQQYQDHGCYLIRLESLLLFLTMTGPTHPVTLTLTCSVFPRQADDSGISNTHTTKESQEIRVLHIDNLGYMLAGKEQHSTNRHCIFSAAKQHIYPYQSHLKSPQGQQWLGLPMTVLQTMTIEKRSGESIYSIVNTCCYSCGHQHQQSLLHHWTYFTAQQ